MFALLVEGICHYLHCDLLMVRKAKTLDYLREFFHGFAANMTMFTLRSDRLACVVSSSSVRIFILVPSSSIHFGCEISNVCETPGNVMDSGWPPASGVYATGSRG
jgi:hypothetical protein